MPDRDETTGWEPLLYTLVALAVGWAAWRVIQTFLVGD